MPGEIMKNEIFEVPYVFSRLISASAAFAEAGSLLREKKYRSALILARGTSDNAAHFLKYLIETQLGMPVGLASASSVTVYNSELHFEDVLVIAISQSGQSPDLVAYAKSAKSAGATLISMTNDPDSPLALIANVHIDLLAGPELAVAATKSYGAQLLASYLLVCAWAGKKAEVADLVSATNLLLAKDLTAGVDKCDINQEIVILGRGFSYPNAREAALKIQETNKVSVQGLSAADYLHGPISALKPDTQVFIFAPDHFPHASLNDAVARIRQTVPTLYWFGLGGEPTGTDVQMGGAHAQNEIIASIADSVLLQRFVLELCLKNGVNPDSPAGLSKVTLTF